jgi:hypothetical protein
LFFKAVEMGHKISSVNDFIRLEGNMLVAEMVTKFAKCAVVPAHLWLGKKSVYGFWHLGILAS